MVLALLMVGVVSEQITSLDSVDSQSAGMKAPAAADSISRLVSSALKPSVAKATEKTVAIINDKVKQVNAAAKEVNSTRIQVKSQGSSVEAAMRKISKQVVAPSKRAKGLSKQEQVEAELAGCKDIPQYARLCPSKVHLCKSKKFGELVTRQCPQTCRACTKSKTKLKNVKCAPKPIVATLDRSLLKVSSKQSKSTGTENVQLNSLKTPWIAAKHQLGQWLEVALPSQMKITKVATQGRYNANQWVTYYRFMYKNKHWRWYDGGKWLRGNWDRTSVKAHKLRPFKARFVRFYPKKWHHKIAMRVEVYGCPEQHAEKTIAKVKEKIRQYVTNTTKAVIRDLDSANKTGHSKQKMVTSAVKASSMEAAKAIKDAAVRAAPDNTTKDEIRKGLSDETLHSHVSNVTNHTVRQELPTQDVTEQGWY